MAEVVELMTKLRMDASEFTEKINLAKEKVHEFSRESSSAMGTFGFGLTTIAGAALSIFSYKIGEAVGHINELYETSRKIGTTTGQLQELQYAMNAFGVGGEQVVKMIGFMDAALGKARMGNDQLGNSFKLLKIDVDQLASKGTEDQLLAIANALGKINDKTVQMALARQIFGRSALDLMGAINSGKLEETLNEYKGTGVSDDNAKEVHKTMEELNLHLAKLSKGFYELAGRSVELANIFFKVTESIGSWVADLALAFDKIINKTGSAPSYGVNKDGSLKSSTTGANMAASYGLRGPASAYQAIANLDQHSAIPNFKTGSNVESLSGTHAEVTNKLKGLGDAAEETSYKLKDLSKIHDMIDEMEKKSTNTALTDLLGDKLGGGKQLKDATKDLKPSGFGSDIDELSKIIAESNVNQYNDFKEQFQNVFADVKKNGLNDKTTAEISGLRKQASGNDLRNEGFDMKGTISAVNDLEKFSKEQNKDKKQESEIKIFLDPQLKGTVIKQEGNKITFEQAISSAASGMGK